MTVRSALLANFLSACSCFIGLILGILIGEIDDVNLWIFAATAGLFLYIALTNMVSQNNTLKDFKSNYKDDIRFLPQSKASCSLALKTE